MTVSANNKNFIKSGGGNLPAGVSMLDPSLSGNPDVVQQRAAAAQRGVMLSRQLKKNKSTGLKVPGQ